MRSLRTIQRLRSKVQNGNLETRESVAGVCEEVVGAAEEASLFWWGGDGNEARVYDAVGLAAEEGVAGGDGVVLGEWR